MRTQVRLSFSEIYLHTFISWMFVCRLKCVCVLWSAALWISTSCITIQQRCAAAKGLYSFDMKSIRKVFGRRLIYVNQLLFPGLTLQQQQPSAVLSVSLTYSEPPLPFTPSTDNTPNNRWATAGRKEIAWPYCLPSPPLCSSQIKGFLINWKVLCRGP